ncbi:peptidase C14, caspase domain-containing protein [Panaeolus papilionaceus]|nr:peptidase C14, caspase domain-containing protein [Panaeolus papilionaceus]
MRKYLMEHHNFKSENIILLTDDELGGASAKPTRREMFNAMSWLVDGARMHDSLFFHYSGHGGQVDDESGQELDGKDEVIFPMDFKEAGDIIDDDLFKTLVEPLPPGARLTAVFDACHSGTVLDLPYLHSAHGRLRSVQHISRRMRSRGQAPSADVISFSACKDDETSADTFHGGVAVGAMSYALITTLKDNPHQTYEQLLRHLRDILIPKYDQKAQISGTHPVDLDRQFIL